MSRCWRREEKADGFGTRNRPQPHNNKEKSTNLSVGAFGGDKRDRTADLLNAIQALSQLSYTPKFFAPLIGDVYYYSKGIFVCQHFFAKNITFFFSGIG